MVALLPLYLAKPPFSFSYFLSLVFLLILRLKNLILTNSQDFPFDFLFSKDF
jgi:hypothetical protein